jgi:hypothetical protein
MGSSRARSVPWPRTSSRHVPVAVSDTPQVTEVLAAEPAPHYFDADELAIR